MLDLYPHQRDAVDRLESGKILYGGVGTGKSRTAVAYYLEKEAPKDVYVITTARKRDSLDWEMEFMRGGISKYDRHPETGAKLFVDSWNNIAKYKNVRGAFFIFDEQRLVGSGVWAKAFEHIAKHGNTWILLTATPGDTWLDYMSVFIANGFYKNRSEFKREHVVYSPHVKQFPKVDHYIGVGKLVRHRRSLLVRMEYLRHTTRIMHYEAVEHDELGLKRLTKERWNPYEDKPVKSLAEYFYVMRKIVYSHPSRLERMRQLLEKHPRIIVFYNFDYELEALRTLAVPKCRVLNAKDVGKRPTANSVYVGRPSKWGNPFVIGKDGTREEVIQQYRDYLLSSGLINDIHELVSKDLICWCSPEGCHADVLKELADAETLTVAEWNGHKHEEVPETDRWVYLVQYISGAEAWNCITTDTTVFYSLNYSYRMFEQGQGRIDRINTPYEVLNYYIFLSKAKIDQGVLSALGEKHNFNESAFARKELHLAS